MNTGEKVEDLVQALARYETRARARRRLLDIGPAAAPALLEVLSRADAPENMRWAAMTLLATWRIREACEPLLALVRENGNLRGEAIRALESISGLEIGDNVEEWETALADPEAYAAGQADRRAEEEAAVEDGQPLEENRIENAVRLFKSALEGLASEISWENDGGYLYLRIPLEAGRKQQVVVTFDETDPGGQPLATIYTECGEATPEAVDSIGRRNVTTKYGKFEIEEGEDGKGKVVMRQRLSLGQLSPELIREAVQAMAREADSLEFELTGADHI